MANPPGLLNPECLLITQKDYEELMALVRRELSNGPLPPGEMLHTDVYSQVDEEIVGCRVG